MILNLIFITLIHNIAWRTRKRRAAIRDVASTPTSRLSSQTIVYYKYKKPFKIIWHWNCSPLLPQDNLNRNMKHCMTRRAARSGFYPFKWLSFDAAAEVSVNIMSLHAQETNISMQIWCMSNEWRTSPRWLTPYLLHLPVICKLTTQTCWYNQIRSHRRKDC